MLRPVWRVVEGVAHSGGSERSAKVTVDVVKAILSVEEILPIFCRVLDPCRAKMEYATSSAQFQFLDIHLPLIEFLCFCPIIHGFYARRSFDPKPSPVGHNSSLTTLYGKHVSRSNEICSLKFFLVLEYSSTLVLRGSGKWSPKGPSP